MLKNAYFLEKTVKIAAASWCSAPRSPHCQSR